MTYEEVLQALEQYKTLGSVYGLEGITRLMNALKIPRCSSKRPLSSCRRKPSLSKPILIPPSFIPWKDWPMTIFSLSAAPSLIWKNRAVYSLN